MAKGPEVQSKELQILNELRMGTPWHLICKKLRVSSKTIARVRETAKTGIIIDESSKNRVNESLSAIGYEVNSAKDLEMVVGILVDRSTNPSEEVFSNDVDPFVRDFYELSVERGYQGAIRDFVRDLAQQFLEDRNLKLVPIPN